MCCPEDDAETSAPPSAPPPPPHTPAWRPLPLCVVVDGAPRRQYLFCSHAFCTHLSLPWFLALLLFFFLVVFFLAVVFFFFRAADTFSCYASTTLMTKWKLEYGLWQGGRRTFTSFCCL